MSRQTKYLGMPQATITKKILRWCIDHLFFLVIVFCFTFLSGFFVLRNNESYKEVNQNCFNEISMMYQMEVDAKLATFKGDSKRQVVPLKDHFNQYLNKMLSLSYSLNPNELSELKEYESYEKLSFENDEISYYFLNYAKIYDAATFYNEVFFEHFDKKYFDNIDTFPNYNIETSKAIYQYLKESKANETYKALYDAFFKVNEIAIHHLSELEEFQAHYKQYEIYYKQVALSQVVALEISYIIAYIAIFVNANLLYPNITAGHVYLRTRYIGKTSSHIVASFLRFLCSHFIIILASLFTFGISVLTVKIGFLTYLQMLLITVFLLGLDFICMCFHKEHLTGIEFISGVREVDIKTYIPQPKEIKTNNKTE